MKISICLLYLVSTAIAVEPISKQFLLAKNWVGHVKVGLNSSLNELYRTYHSVRLIDRQLEGMFSPALQVYLNNPDVPAFIVNIHWRRGTDELGSIIVYDRCYKTANGIGVGSTLGELRRHYKDVEVLEGEGPFFARVPELSMSFRLYSGDLPSDHILRQDPTAAPDSARIESIRVMGD